MTSESFGVRVRQAGDWQVVELIGELDMATAPILADRLEGLVGSNVVVDLLKLTFTDSSGISALVSARKKITVDQRQFVLTRTRTNVRRTLEIVGLADWTAEWSPDWSTDASST